jgi:predicted secreted Zn-dependent protease
VRALICVSAAWAVTACSPGPGGTRPMPRGVVIQGSTQYFPIAGRTEAEIGAALREAGLREQGFAGHYRASWRHTYRIGGGSGAMRSSAGCRITDVRVDLQSVIREPEWQRPPDAPAELAAEWQAFADALDDHEREHEKIAVEAAGDFVRTLEQLREMSCQELSLEATREAERLSDDLQEREARLDRETVHGLATGARWPPPRRAPADSVR